MKKQKFIAVIRYIYCLTMTAGSVQLTLSAPNPHAARRSVSKMMAAYNADIVSVKIVQL